MAPAKVNFEMPVAGDFNTVPVQQLQDQTQFAAVGETWPTTFSPDLFSEASINLGLDAWLTHENVDGFLHNWDFVLDPADVGPVTNEPTYSSSKPLANLQQVWYTHIDNDNQAASGYATPVPRHEEVDDNYRRSLHRRLQVPSSELNLPSADFLNLCVRSYFKRFHRLFPVIHAPTFRPSKSNSVLLLSICSIGSLLTGYPSANQRGTQLFERLNKSIINHWEQLMSRGPDEALAMIQAALIGQTFGLLSGQAKHLALVDAFHGTVISWARRLKLFQTQHSSLPANQDLDSKWRTWIQTEEKIRVALGLRVHDAEIASMLHHEALLASASRLSHASSDALFYAPSAQEWFSLYRDNVAYPVTPTSEGSPGSALPEILQQRLMLIPIHCHFTIYAALEDVASAIIEARINGSLTPAFTDRIQQCLIASYRQHLHTSHSELIRSAGRILWHYLFLTLHSDLNLLERSVGRDGPDLDASDQAKVYEWANSSSAKRCAAHAIMIKKILESFPLTSEPAMHVPRAMFSSAICLFCYSKYGEGGASSDPPDPRFPELQLLDADVSSLLREVKRSSSTDVEIGPLCGLVDLLQRIGHWEISRTFASILGVLLQAESG